MVALALFVVAAVLGRVRVATGGAGRDSIGGVESAAARDEAALPSVGGCAESIVAGAKEEQWLVSKPANPRAAELFQPQPGPTSKLRHRHMTRGC